MSDLVSTPEDRFSQNEAHFIAYKWGTLLLTGDFGEILSLCLLGPIGVSCRFSNSVVSYLYVRLP